MTRCFKDLGSILLILVLFGCGGGSKSTAPVETKVNQAPIAQIDLDKSTFILASSVNISGEKSKDPEGDDLSYHWQIKNEAGDDYPLDNSNANAFTFTPEHFGSYTIMLKVSDAKKTSPTVSSIITVEPNAQSYPVAKTSDNMINKVGNTNWFNADKSLASSGQQLTYKWEIKSKPTQSLSEIGDSTAVRAYLIADKAGRYQISLTVTNIENQLSNTSTLILDIDDIVTNSSPVAIIESSQLDFAVNDLVKLSASESYDSDNDLLDYKWSIEKQPLTSTSFLSSSTSEFVDLTLDVEGEYHVKLVVSDKHLSNENIIIITASNQNIIPVANAGADRTAIINEIIELNASASSDSEGQTLEYEWSLISKPATSGYSTLSEPKLITQSKFIFEPDVIGEYLLSLRVFDGVDYSNSDQVHILVSENQRPVAKLGQDITVSNSDTLLIDAGDSYDPEGQPLTYSWEVTSAPDGFDGAILTANEYVSFASFKPSLSGSYTIQLTVNDGIQNSIPETMVIFMVPIEWRELTVTGLLIDKGGIPLSEIEIGGMSQKRVLSNDDGKFELLLRSQTSSPSEIPLLFKSTKVKAGFLVLPETEDEQLDLGTVTLPVMQSKNISVKACNEYTGENDIMINFHLSNSGYKDMRFIWPERSYFTVNSGEKEVFLPAEGEIMMRLSAQSKGSIYLDNGASYFTHNYQADDTQPDSLVITICN
ncbi:PKD domain-containing protein [Pseudoalteromonas denitrificans]|uniref:REJ domain-containing protein n=1 Tax=Pseudoalteromonas denitrificans DSM 6059 TaxID=1123010 RepID=A0A1I1T487_9GAMM|nr:PKD domain-containing protein [Pseudoalteromonas denitrificans]SFD53515.1 REJ domain-containing protein [Pseudoalteromonas denitrificans DSM 6059]